MGIDYEEKAFYDILEAVAKKYEFEYPDDKMIELSKRIKNIVDDKARYTEWSTREDIKANLQVDLILLLDEFDYPPVTILNCFRIFQIPILRYLWAVMWVVLLSVGILTIIGNLMT